MSDKIKNKESFVLHLDMLQDVKHMGIEEKAQFLDFVINYNEGRASIDDLEPGMFKSFMRLFANQFDRDTEKWEKTRQRRSESGRKGGLAKSSKCYEKPSKCYEKPSKCYEKPSKAKHNVNVNVNVNENENKNKNENGECLDAFNNAIDFPRNHPEKLDDYLNEKPW
jgi:hypothetical protein